MTDQYAELHAEIARLRGDLDFERDVADKPRAFGPPPGSDVVDDSGYFTALRVGDLLAAGKLREAADPHCTRDRPRCRRRMTAPPWRCSGRPPSRPPCCSPPTTSRPYANPNRFYGAILTRYPATPTTQY